MVRVLKFSVEHFKNPPAEFRPTPFWSLNDLLRIEELKRQVTEFKCAGCGGFFMHARTGLVTPYLSEAWFHCIKACVEEATKLGLKAWIYDEYNWPSGSAGGRVPRLRPEFRQKALKCIIGKEEGRIIAKFWLKIGSDGNVLEFYKEEREGTTLVCFSVVENPGYVDMFNPNAVDEFIRLTHEAYEKSVGKYFSSTIPGVFTDEPQCATIAIHPFTVPWSEHLRRKFMELWNYDIIDYLPCLFFKTLNYDYRRVRYHFWLAVSECFAKTFTKRIFEWCEKRKLIFTGHFEWEDSFLCQLEHIGCAMLHYFYMQMPGFDKLGRRLYFLDRCRDKLGREVVISVLIAARQVSSIARQMKRRALCEAFGVAGWNLSLEEQKWIVDYLYAQGINFLNQHISHYSLRGLRKRDCPPSIFFQQPWWRYYKLFCDYVARLSYLMSISEPVCEVLVIHPLGSAWYLYDHENIEPVNKLNEEFAKLSQFLVELHREFDYGCEEVLERVGAVENGMLKVGVCRYPAVIVPLSITLRETTVSLLERFVEEGGRLIFVEEPPRLIDGTENPRLTRLVSKAICVKLEKEEIRKSLESIPQIVQLSNPEGKEVPTVLSHVKRIGSMLLLFLTNTSRSRGEEVVVKLNVIGKVLRLDPLTGKIENVPSEVKGSMMFFEVKLDPVGSAVFLIDPSKSPIKERKVSKMKKTRIVAVLSGKWKVSRLDPNCLLLDYCQYSLGDSWSSRVPVWKAHRELTKHIGKRAKVRFTFKVNCSPDKIRDVYLVLETPKVFEIKVNGVRVSSRDEGWWIDTAFRKIPIRGLLRQGLNTIELSFVVNQGIELENCYIIGNFSVFEAGSIFYIDEEKEEVDPFNLVEEGYPFYAGRMLLSKELNIDATLDHEYYLTLRSLSSIVTRVKINGKEVGVICWPPHRVKLSGSLQKGSNRVEIELVTSLRNLLGPHHHVAGELIAVGGSEFTDEEHWTDEYHFVRVGFREAVIEEEI